ncbi:MAG: ABC transporter substrate-binding protein [Nanoarchaeota archaeon]|nr:ABC transporter substrate-binding protein [Nanoarchaeota archaeon]
MVRIGFKIAIAILLVAIIMFSGCATQLTGKATVEPIKIGYIGILTGMYATIGIPNVRGIEIAVEEINAAGGIAGRPVELIIEDAPGVEKRAFLNAFYKLTEIDNIDALLSFHYGSLIAITETADQNKIVLVESIDTSEEIAAAGEYLFGPGVYDEGFGHILADFITDELNKKEAGIVTNNGDPITELIKNSFIIRFEKNGGTIVFDESYAPETTDFRSLLLKIKNRDVDPLVVIGWDEAGFMLKQAKELGLDIQFLGWDQFTVKQFLVNAAGGAEGAYTTMWESPNQEKLDSLIVRYKKKYGHDPENIFFTSTGYDAAMVTFEAMKQTIEEGKEPRGEDLKNAMHKIKDYKGILGTITIDEDGIARSITEKVRRIENNQFVEI